jgi:hypothetical protein
VRLFDCPFFDGAVELTDEREDHIQTAHPDLLPEHLDELTLTLAEPDDVIQALEVEKRFFLRRSATIGSRRYVVAVVVSDTSRTDRHWLVTAFLTRRRPVGTE